MKRFLLLCTLFFGLPLLPLRAQQVHIKDIFMVGNNLTKNHIITRELPFKKGDTLEKAFLDKQLEVARENLLNLSLFHTVEFTYLPDPDELQAYYIIIDVEERWYIWPILEVQIRERNLSTWMDQWDFSRLTFEAGANIENFLGLNHKLKISGRIGYDWGGRITYRGLALDRAQKHYLTLESKYNVSHNLDVYTTSGNPQEDDPSVRPYSPRRVISNHRMLHTSWENRLNYYFRKSIREQHNITLLHHYEQIDRSVLELNPHYWGGPDTCRHAFRLEYFYQLDHRDNQKYPLKGYYFKTGVNTYFAPKAQVNYVQAHFKGGYFQPVSSRWYVSTVLSAGASYSNQQAYILDKAIGYQTVMLRGYERTVADGQSYLVLNNTIKYNLMATRTFTLNWLSRFPKFNKVPLAIYLNAHFDAGYAHNKWDTPPGWSTLSNRWMYAAGAGIDIITYYDIILGGGWAYNREGQGQFYFSLTVPFL